MRLLYSFCFLFFGLSAISQKTVKGVVLNESNKPVPNATVFVNTTCIGTTADGQGNFSLKLPNGRCTIIVASPGFETYSERITPNQLPDLLTVNLRLKSLQKNIYEKNGWANWGNFFMISFIGSSAHARDCKIKNPKAIHFFAPGERNELTASSDEPLIIENKALGYTIKYYLESFVFNFQTLFFSYTGYSFFQPMNGSTTKQNVWEKNRSEAYFGSLMHFMRSVYRNQIEKEGFDVRRLKKRKNIPSYQNNKADSLDSAIKIKESTNTISDNADEEYEDQILNEDHYRDVIGTTLPGDSIAYAVSQTTAGLGFNGFLMVTYQQKETPPEYQEQIGGTGMTSQLILINNKPVEIESDGSYYDSRDLLVLGYWTWAQKIANALPFDYNPPTKKTP